MIRIHNTDAIRWAKDYDGPLFHALLTDAPYHLTTITKRFGKKDSKPAKPGKDGAFGRLSKGFMGNTWDGGDIAFQPETWAAFQKVLYPGAFGMAFAGSRGWHRMAVAIEDAGFIVHPTIFLWAYSSGFPKATNPSELLKPNRGIVQAWKGKCLSNWAMENMAYQTRLEWYRKEKAFEGYRYGLQAMKPAVEPIIVFQKPYDRKPLDNITQTGAGALNIDGSRIGTEAITINRWKDSMHPFGDGAGNEFAAVESQGRWPANFLLDAEAAARLNQQTGGLTSGEPSGVRHALNSFSNLGRIPLTSYGDSGGAARFFFNVQQDLDQADPVYYCGKASPTEREAGLEEQAETTISDGRAKSIDNPYQRGETIKHNPHPTVKPLDLCRHLASLLLPPVEYAPRRIFVPFSGVGSECIGAHLAGWEEVDGVEFDTENRYVEVAQARIKYWTSKPVQLDLEL